jgi:hypothetical protein
VLPEALDAAGKDKIKRRRPAQVPPVSTNGNGSPRR